MSASWLPLKDAALQTFCVNMSAKITSSAASYGLASSDATTLAGLVTAYNSSLATATNPSTRTKTAVVLKNTCKAQLVADVRSVAKRIQANPAVTSAQKTDLGLPIHSATPTPIPPPTVTPTLRLTAVVPGARSIGITIVGTEDRTTRARPAGTAGAEVYSYVSDGPGTPPTDLEAWRFEGMATKGSMAITYNGEDVGKQAYIVARWYNAKGETGPLSPPITGTIAA